MNFEKINLEKKENPETIWTGEIDSFDFDEKTRQFIREKVTNPDNFLGEGGVAKVFNLGDSCIKIMPNRHKDANASMFDLGNSVFQEAEIQNKLNDLRVENVFAPRVFGYYEGEKSTAIIMERLDAINLQLAILKKEKFPVKFNLDDFFEALEEYVDSMHEIGIVHNDLEARNVMIDKKTGLPRVIDFGRSTYYSEKPEDYEKIIKRDLDNLGKIYVALENIFNA